MKVFIYYGNEENLYSRSTAFVKLLREALDLHHGVSDVIMRTATNTNLAFMSTWSDVLSYDEKTNKKDIAKEMLQADVIIFISPVFLHHISGYMKVFLDNFASWAHTMPLIGKVGIPISLSNNNGNEYVGEYLKKIMNYFGMETMNPIGLELEHVNEHAIRSYVRYILRSGIDNIHNVLDLAEDKKKINEIYQVNKKNIIEYNDDHPEKYQYAALGYNKCETYQEAIVYRRTHELKGDEL